MANFEALKRSYDERYADASRLAERLAEQIGVLIDAEGITLAVPIEHRVKSWRSTHAKIEQKKIEIEKIVDLSDLVGLRIILLFRRDVDRVHSLIAELMHEARSEDASERLGTETFGYQSVHLSGMLPRAWIRLPTFRNCSDLPVEVQIRTTAQHIWAAASHLLQYKSEGSVPKDVLRSINRVAALLETVDLEFERVLEQRENYTKGADTGEENQVLNVDLLRKVLEEMLPSENQDDIAEDYEEILSDLRSSGINTVGHLRKLIVERLPDAKAYEAAHVDKSRIVDIDDASTIGEEIDVTLIDGMTYGTTWSRHERGVFLNHEGYIVRMLIAAGLMDTKGQVVEGGSSLKYGAIS